MEIKKIAINEVEPWEDNPRIVKKDDFDRLKNQIKKLGIYKPLLVYQKNGKYICLGGNSRLIALREMGIQHIEVSIVAPKNKAEMIEYALSDNDQIGKYDPDKVAEIIYPHMAKIQIEDFKIDLGEPVSLQKILDGVGPVPDEKPVTDTPETAERYIEIICTKEFQEEIAETLEEWGKREDVKVHIS